MAFSRLVNRNILLCHRAKRLIRFTRYSFCSHTPNPANGKFRLNKPVCWGILVTGAVGSAGVYATYEVEEKELDAMFKIKRQPPMPFERKNEKKEWKRFIRGFFAGSDGAIYWLYGDKNVGKSTMLEQVAYELQSEYTNNVREKQLFYINLETIDGSPETYIENLRKVIKQNAAKGIKSRVVFDSVGVLSSKKTDDHLPDNATQREFDTMVGPKGPWVEQWFRFAKWCCDQNHTRFIFLTSKPYDLAINQRGYAYNIRDRSTQIEVSEGNDFGKLRLKLSKKEAIDYVHHKQHIETTSYVHVRGDELVKTIEEVNDDDWFSSDYCKIGFLKRVLSVFA